MTAGSFLWSLSRSTVSGTPKIPVSSFGRIKGEREKNQKSDSFMPVCQGQSGKRSVLSVTSSFDFLCFASFQLNSKGIKKGGQFDQREMADLLHVLRGQVSRFGEPKSGLLDNKFLKHKRKILGFDGQGKLLYLHSVPAGHFTSTELLQFMSRCSPSLMCI